MYQDPNITKRIPDARRTRREALEELKWHMNGHPQDPILGLWATVLKETGKFVGRCGLLLWKIDGREEIEVAGNIRSESRP